MENLLIDIKDYNNLQKYSDIMKKYRSGEYGSEPLSMYEILVKSGNPNLLDQMSLEELDILINDTFGIKKSLFIEKKNELISKQENKVLVKNK